MKTTLLSLLILSIFLSSGFRPKTPQAAVNQQNTAQPANLPKMILAKVFIKPGSEADFISIAKTMISNVSKEEGCTGYMLYQDPYKKTDFIFVESYKNQAAIDAHFATPYFKEFGTKIGNLTSKPSEIKIIDVAGVK